MNTNTGAGRTVVVQYTRPNSDRHFVSPVSLSRFNGDLNDVDALRAHCQKVMEIAVPGAVVITVGPIANRGQACGICGQRFTGSHVEHYAANHRH